ncbi:MAG TPA: sulfur reduction protein DsrE [Bacteroidales bacterium]|nr:sulfur reduction protein DsrE [Bacteroidales bacterium]
MKKIVVVLFLLGSLFINASFAQFDGQKSAIKKPTSIGMVISTNDVETMWNVLRLANFAKEEGDTVSIFLLGKGVELDLLVKQNKDLQEQSDAFLEKGGTILGCGTCLSSRKNDAPQVCKFSSMSDLYNLVRKNAIVLTF